VLNRIDLLGRLTADPELRMTSGDVAVTTFTLAVERDYKNQSGERESDFFTVTCWRGTAEFASRNFSKGQMMAVTGRLQNRQYTDKEGNKRTVSEIIAENVYFAGPKPGAKFEENEDPGELPF
jgi:single-strand DNA-binding protein